MSAARRSVSGHQSDTVDSDTLFKLAPKLATASGGDPAALKLESQASVQIDVERELRKAKLRVHAQYQSHGFG
jgi:hypothetical protein